MPQDEERLQIIKEKSESFLLSQQERNSVKTELTTSGYFAATRDLIVIVLLYSQMWEFGPACFITVLQLKRVWVRNYERLQIISCYEFAILTFRRRICYHMMTCTLFVTNVFICPFLVSAKTWKGVISITQCTFRHTAIWKSKRRLINTIW
jgi:hypothetical protein